jgi:hypothetical protein
MKYTSYDYLWDESYHIEGIGNVKCPTLREIRKITYNVFAVYMNIAVAGIEDIIKMYELSFSPEDIPDVSVYQLMLNIDPNLLVYFIRFFIVNDLIKYNKEDSAFEIYNIKTKENKETENVLIGKINNDNFNDFRKFITYILGITTPSKKEKKYKSERARKLVEKIEREKKKQKEQAKKNDDNFDLDNMILKYCTHNKVGINLLNVGDLTYYQFIKLFNEYFYARQVDYNDLIAGNTFSYKEATDYKPTLWVEKIKDDNL